MTLNSFFLYNRKKTVISSGDVSSLTNTTFSPFPPIPWIAASSAVNTTLPQAAPGDAPKPFPAGVAFFNASTSNCGCNNVSKFLGSIINTASSSVRIPSSNDQIANPMVDYLLSHKVNIPQQMAVVSFDNSFYSNLSTCRITSLSHGSLNVGRSAAEALIRLFEGKPVHSQTVPWILVEKESS